MHWASFHLFISSTNFPENINGKIRIVTFDIKNKLKECNRYLNNFIIKINAKRNNHCKILL